MNDIPTFATHPTGIPVDPGHDFSVVMDSNGQPMTFSLGTDGNLYVIRRTSETGSNWEQVNISAQFGRRFTAQTFAVIQHSTGQITLAVSITTKSWLGEGKLYVANHLSNDPGAVNWRAAPGLFVERPANLDIKFQMVNIFLGAANEDDPFPLLVVDAKNIGAQAGVDHYVVSSDPSQLAQSWEKVSLPHDVDQTLQVKFGHHGIPALWTIYDVGKDRVVEVKTLPHPDWPNEVSRDYKDLPAGVDTLTLAPGDDPVFDDVYVGGDGIVVYRGRKNTEPEVILDANVAYGVRQLGVSRLATGGCLVWYVSGDDTLSIVAKDAVSNEWSEPVVLSSNIQRFGFPNESHSSMMEVVVLTPDRALEYRKRATPNADWVTESIPIEPIWDLPPLTSDELDEVIKKYSPHLYLHSEEAFFMSSVEWYLSNVGLWDEQGDTWRVRPGLLWNPNRRDMDLSEVPPCTKENKSNFWLKIPDDPNDRILDSDVVKAGKRDGEGVEAYLHAKFLPSEDCTDIQFWLFCPFNGAGAAYMWIPTEEKGRVDLSPLGEHEGDWEHVTLRIDNYEMIVKGAYLSQHGDQPWIPEKDMDRDADGRVMVYASRHGHANYHKPGRHLHPESETEHVYHFGLRNDADKGFHIDLAQRAALVSAEFLGEEAPREPDWLQFHYRWGRRLVFGRGTVEDVFRENIPVTIDVILGLLPGGFFLNNALFSAIFPNVAYDKLLPDSEKYSWGPTAPKTKALWTDLEEKGE